MPLEDCCRDLLPVSDALSRTWDLADRDGQRECVVALMRCTMELQRILLIEALDLESENSKRSA